MNTPTNFSSMDKDTPIVVGVSGGCDSMALLHLLHSKGFQNLIIAHVDHGVRMDSYRDAQLVSGYSKQLNIPFFLRRVDLPSLVKKLRENEESLARNIRYSFFRELKKKHRAKYIATAHHADDQVETVLMNFIRGCGLDGLSGIRTVDTDLWRPLLSLSKETLYQYCHHHDIPFVRDPTNDDTKYRRNYLRHKIIPLLKNLNPNLLNTLGSNIRNWQLAADDLRARAKNFLNKSQDKENRYRLSPFLELSELDQSIVIRELYHSTHGNKNNLAQDHIDQVLRVLRKNVSGKKKEFGPGKCIMRGRVYFEIIDSP